MCGLTSVLALCAGCPKHETKSAPAAPPKAVEVDSALMGEFSTQLLREWKMNAALGEIDESFNWAVTLYVGASKEDPETAKKEAARLFADLKKNSKDKGIQAFLKHIEMDPKPDEAQVKKWMEAGKAGDADAMIHAGIACFLGEGVKEDRIQAVKWLHGASSRQEHDGVLSLLEGRLGERLSFQQQGYARRIAREEGLAIDRAAAPAEAAKAAAEEAEKPAEESAAKPADEAAKEK